MSAYLRQLPYDAELAVGARNAVRVCLRVHPSEKVTLIADHASAEIAAAILRELEDAGATVNSWILEELASRPLSGMPRPVLEDLETSNVSVFTVQAQANELPSRMQMTEVVNRRKIRHAHMVNITTEIMLKGMRADYREVDQLSLRLLEIVRKADFVRAATPAGTDLVARMNPEYKWLKTSGIISENTWGNLPGGEVWTTPGEVNGTFVVDGVVGDYLCAKYGDLKESPLVLRVEGNRLREAHSENRELEQEFWRYTHTDENSDLVGEFAIGTNIAVHDVIGNILQDEKIPGVHIAFGNPYGDHTGARWYSSTHIDVVGRNFDIWADDRPLMRGGEFLAAAVIEHLRRQFNESFTPQRYAGFLQWLEERCGVPILFRNCETPCFFPRELMEEIAAVGADLVRQLVGNPEYMAACEHTVPDLYRVPREAEKPLFVQADFGLIQEESGRIRPRLVEIQGFPSLYAYQPVLSQTYQECFDLEDSTGFLLNSVDEARYVALLRRAILGGHDPENVILLEIHPDRQKTLPDFKLTEKLLGIRTVCLSTLIPERGRLYYQHQGKRIPVTRIYNRVIVDELDRKGLRAPFDYREDFQVEWAGHPNWYFRLSKFSIPFLRHECVPRTWFLDQWDEIPDDLQNWVLKPLYSFAGVGVKVGPSREDLESIPFAQRHQYLLQERVRFTPLIRTPSGPTMAEIRIMYLWQDQLLALCPLVRMGRGKMMGVDHNRDLDWVGASTALYPIK